MGTGFWLESKDSYFDLGKGPWFSTSVDDLKDIFKTVKLMSTYYGVDDYGTMSDEEELDHLTNYCVCAAVKIQKFLKTCGCELKNDISSEYPSSKICVGDRYMTDEEVLEWYKKNQLFVETTKNVIQIMDS